MELLATFHTHYGALQFDKYCKKENIIAKMQPVPRELSASCGVCIRFSAQTTPKKADHEDMDCCYTVLENGGYCKI